MDVLATHAIASLECLDCGEYVRLQTFPALEIGLPLTELHQKFTNERTEGRIPLRSHDPGSAINVIWK